MRRSVSIVVWFLLGAALLWVYFLTRLPPGVESKGGPESWTPWISLIGAVVSLLAAVINLIRSKR